jgi:hypothetical protein
MIRIVILLVAAVVSWFYAKMQVKVYADYFEEYLRFDDQPVCVLHKKAF